MSLQKIHARAQRQATMAEYEVAKARKALNDCNTAVKNRDSNAFYTARKRFFDASDALTVIARTSCQACYVEENFWESLSRNDLSVFDQARTLFGHTD